MKRIFHINTALILLLCAAFSCIKEPEMGGSKIDGPLPVKLNLHLPSDMRGGASTRSIADEDESTIADVELLAFLDDGGGNFQYTYSAPVESTTNNNGQVEIVATAQGYSGQQIFMVLVNAPAGASSGIVRNMSLAAARQQLLVTEANEWNAASSGDYRPLPMYAETSAATVTAGATLGNYDLVRMLARIDVRLKAGVSNFEIVEAHLFNRRTSGQMAFPFDAATWDAAGKRVRKTTYPQAAIPGQYKPSYYDSPGYASTPYKADITDDSRGEILRSIYTFEAKGVSETDRLDATAVIVGGKYDDSNDVTYYRVDIVTASTPAGNCSQDILRNHWYDIEIQSFSGAGYGNPEDAFVGGSQLTATVTEWNLATQGVIGDGQWWLMVNRDEIVYDYLGGETDITAQTNYNPVPTQGFPAGIRVDAAEIEYTPAVASGDEWITLTDVSGSDGTPQRTIKISAAQNASATGRAAKVKIRAGNFTKVINVEQSGAAFTFNVTGVAAAYTYAGGVQTFTVESHVTATLSDGTTSTFAVPWTAQFSEDGETWTDEAPEWLIIPTSGAGSTVATQYNAELLAMEESENVNEQDNTLRTNPTRGAADAPYDLSTKGDTEAMNTANCYIINGGGYYKLPLVYGNAVKGGATNSSAYISSQNASSTLLKNFLRHDGLAITGPYIYDQFTPADAVLVWMDYPGLIVNVRLTDENKYLAFDIPQSTMGQGNAIVAVRDASGTIMWSWHIWVTPLVNMDNPATDATTNRTLVTRYFMQYNLGWCTGRAAITYGTGPRSVQMQFKQAGTNTMRTFTLMQNNGNSTVTEVNNPFWQWGRKDPLTPGTGIEKSYVDKITYGNYKYTAAVSTGTIGSSIQNPHMFYPSSGNWTLSGNYYNLWSADNTVTAVNDNPVVKTVYDPSPTGFVMPAPAAWTGFTTTGDSSGNPPSVIRAAHPFNLGWNFYANYPENSGSAFYPASGCRINTGVGNLSLSGRNGYVWAATPYNVTKGNYMSMYDGVVDPQNNIARAYGIPVRPCKEQ